MWLSACIKAASLKRSKIAEYWNINLESVEPDYVTGNYIEAYYLPDRKSRGKLQETEGSNP